MSLVLKGVKMGYTKKTSYFVNIYNEDLPKEVRDYFETLISQIEAQHPGTKIELTYPEITVTEYNNP